MSLDLNYQPEVVVETEGMPEDEWLKWRRNGIGGSDASTIMGDSPWRTIVDLYFDKTGVKPAIEEVDNAFAKDYGHVVEPLIAKWFKKKTGMNVWKDTKMYRHPLFHFMLADLDYRINDYNGKNGILEIKSTTYRNSSEWIKGELPIYYEEQVRHYMAVMNLDFVWICCLWGNNFDSDSAQIYVERDLAQEEMLIQNEQMFWNNVLNKIQPSYDGCDTDLALKSLKKYIGAGDKKLPAIALDPEFEDSLDEITRLSEEKDEMKEKIKVIDKQIDTLSIPIIQALQNTEHGELVLPDITYRVEYPTKFTATFDRKKCRQLYPDVFAELSGQSSSRSFKVKKVETAEQATA